MRKIASNYLLNDNKIIEFGYFIFNGVKVVGVATLNREQPEEHGVEFYAGLLVPGKVDLIGAMEGERIDEYLDRVGYWEGSDRVGITLVCNLDWSTMRIKSGTNIRRLG